MRDEPCDHVSGECSNGCQDGFEGTHCNSCEIWIFYLDVVALKVSFLIFEIFLHVLIQLSTGLFVQRALSGITAGTVLMFVPLPVRHVDTQTDCVLVRRDGQVQDVMKVIFFSNFPNFLAVYFLSRLDFKNKNISGMFLCRWSLIDWKLQIRRNRARFNLIIKWLNICWWQPIMYGL